jgi:hypothetical protein
VSLMRGLVQGWPKQIGSTWITRAYELPSRRLTAILAGYRFSFALTVDDLICLRDLRTHDLT